MENQNINQEQTQEQKQPQGWRDVNIIPDMPLNAIIQFLNILNQRLCGVEDSVLIETPDGGRVSITQAYEIQAQLEEQARKEILKNQQTQNNEQQGE